MCHIQRHSSKLKMWMVYLPSQLAPYKKSLKKLIKSVTVEFYYRNKACKLVLKKTSSGLLNDQFCFLCFDSHFYLLTYLLTPWCRVLLQKLTGLQLVKKFPAFHGTRRFITTLTSVRHLSLSWASPIQSTYPHPTSWRSF